MRKKKKTCKNAKNKKKKFFLPILFNFFFLLPFLFLTRQKGSLVNIKMFYWKDICRLTSSRFLFLSFFFFFTPTPFARFIRDDRFRLLSFFPLLTLYRSFPIYFYIFLLFFSLNHVYPRVYILTENMQRTTDASFARINKFSNEVHTPRCVRETASIYSFIYICIHNIYIHIWEYIYTRFSEQILIFFFPSCL